MDAEHKLSFGDVFRIVWFAWLAFVLIDIAVSVVALALYAAWVYSALPLVFAAIVAVVVIWFLFWASH